MAEQLRHLLTLRKRDNITLQVIPFGTGAYGNMSGGCMIIGYADKEYSSAVYVEHTTGGMWVEDGTDVQRFESMFGDTVEAALGPDKSAKLIRSQSSGAEHLILPDHTFRAFLKHIQAT